MQCQVGNGRGRWLALCCAGWLLAAQGPALAAHAQPAGSSHAEGLAQFKLKKTAKPLTAGKVRERTPVPARKARVPDTGVPSLAGEAAPPENPLLPDAPGRNPFADAPPEAGEMSSRVGVAGRGVTLGVAMPF